MVKANEDKSFYSASSSLGKITYGFFVSFQGFNVTLNVIIAFSGFTSKSTSKSFEVTFSGIRFAFPLSLTH